MKEKEFDYDPEERDRNKVLRLPFALCKSKGIPIQDWWRPRDAWAALQGFADFDPGEEMKKFFKKLKRSNKNTYSKRKKAQLADPEHNPDKNYVHQEGAIAGAKKGKAMTFEEADSGNVNPNFAKGAIGYYHNCQTCVATYIARLKGYDVRALPNLNNRSIYWLSHDTSLAYVDKDGNNPQKIKKGKGERIDKWLNKTLEEGKIYSFEFGYVGRKSGHIITVEKNNGKISFYDPQSNTKLSDGSPAEMLFNHYGKIDRIEIMNLSDCELDTKFCDSIMKANKKFDDDFDVLC